MYQKKTHRPFAQSISKSQPGFAGLTAVLTLGFLTSVVLGTIAQRNVGLAQEIVRLQQDLKNKEIVRECLNHAILEALKEPQGVSISQSFSVNNCHVCLSSKNNNTLVFESKVLFNGSHLYGQQEITLGQAEQLQLNKLIFSTKPPNTENCP